jgi:hypothetical protein
MLRALKVTKKLVLLIFFLLVSFEILAQGFSYTFTDPCTYKTKEIYIDNPNGNVALIYNGQIKSFSPQDLTNGGLQSWIAQVNSTNPSGPCSGIALVQNTTMNALLAQNNIAVLTTVISVMSDVSTLGGGNMIEGVVGSNEKSSDKEEKDNSQKNKNNDQNGNDGTKSSNNENKTSDGGGQSNGESKSGENTDKGTGGENDSQGGGTSTEDNTTQGGNQETKQSVNKESEETVGGASEAKSSSQVKNQVSNAKRGNIMMTGDVVVIKNANTEDRQQLKVNLSYVKSNTKNTFVRGALGNFTTTINNSSVTLFAAFKQTKFNTIIANSSMLNFQKDYFNTTSFMESYKFWKFTGTLGVNFTVGNLGTAKFKSESAIGGVVGSFNLGKKMGVTPMFVMVYSPFVYYYEGLWYKSGWLAVPFLAVDYKITKKFKFNISFSGVQPLKDATLNYQVLMGAKALL